MVKVPSRNGHAAQWNIDDKEARSIMLSWDADKKKPVRQMKPKITPQTIIKANVSTILLYTIITSNNKNNAGPKTQERFQSADIATPLTIAILLSLQLVMPTLTINFPGPNFPKTDYSLSLHQCFFFYLAYLLHITHHPTKISKTKIKK